jgi:hypothetical protein
MRVAISGTHCSGKSTLIDAFLQGHIDYVHEPEPYEQLQDGYGEGFAAEPTADDFYHQLEYQAGRLRQYQIGDRVIFERSPVDFVAYLLAIGDLNRATHDLRFAERSVELARDAVSLLDIIVFLPASGWAGAEPDSEDPKLRRAVDTRLEDILMNDDFGLFTADRPAVLEASGTTAQRLQTLESALR